MCTYRILFIHSSVGGHLGGCFYLWAPGNHAAVNVGAETPNAPAFRPRGGPQRLREGWARGGVAEGMCVCVTSSGSHRCLRDVRGKTRSRTEVTGGRPGPVAGPAVCEEPAVPACPLSARGPRARLFADGNWVFPENQASHGTFHGRESDTLFILGTERQKCWRRPPVMVAANECGPCPGSSLPRGDPARVRAPSPSLHRGGRPWPSRPQSPRPPGPRFAAPEFDGPDGGSLHGSPAPSPGPEAFGDTSETKRNNTSLREPHAS